MMILKKMSTWLVFEMLMTMVWLGKAIRLAPVMVKIMTRTVIIMAVVATVVRGMNSLSRDWLPLTAVGIVTLWDSSRKAPPL